MFGRRLVSLAVVLFVVLPTLLGARPAAADVPDGFEDRFVASVESPSR